MKIRRSILLTIIAVALLDMAGAYDLPNWAGLIMFLVTAATVASSYTWTVEHPAPKTGDKN